jgi:hypothetical protein
MSICQFFGGRLIALMTKHPTQTKESAKLSDAEPKNSGIWSIYSLSIYQWMWDLPAHS